MLSLFCSDSFNLIKRELNTYFASILFSSFIPLLFLLYPKLFKYIIDNKGYILFIISSWAVLFSKYSSKILLSLQISQKYSSVIASIFLSFPLNLISSSIFSFKSLSFFSLIFLAKVLYCTLFIILFNEDKRDMFLSNFLTSFNCFKKCFI